MSFLAVNEIVKMANAEIRDCHAKLEIEESGREVAGLQGKIAGSKDLLRFLKEAFDMTVFGIDDSGEAATVIPDMDDLALEALAIDITALKLRPEWSSVLAMVEERTEGMKNFLLFSAEKSRDLDLKQGEHKGMTQYHTLFNAVESERNRREKDKKDSLDFGDGPAGEAGFTPEEARGDEPSLDPLAEQADPVEVGAAS